MVRTRLADAACVLACLALGALLLRVGDAGWTGPATHTDAAVGAACSLAMWYRRKWPLGLAVALVPAGAVAGSATPALAVAVFTVAVHRRAALAIPVAAAHVASVAVYFVLQDDPRHPLGVDLAVRGGLVAAALGWGMFARAQRRLVASLRERAARLEAEQRLRVQGARLTERTRIAREMHDVLAHRLSLVSLHAGALEVRTDASGEEVSAAAGVIRTSAHEALRELRTVIGVLRDTSANPLDGASDPVDGERPQPGLGDVPALVEAARAAGTPVDYACRLDGLDGATARTVYRTIQEGLTNARKHAPGAPVAVLVDAAPGGGIRVCLTNPAAPGGPAGAGVPGSGTGLVGLAERIALAGGRLEHGPAGDGFRLTVWLP